MLRQRHREDLRSGDAECDAVLGAGWNGGVDGVLQYLGRRDGRGVRGDEAPSRGGVAQAVVGVVEAEHRRRRGPQWRRGQGCVARVGRDELVVGEARGAPRVGSGRRLGHLLTLRGGRRLRGGVQRAGDQDARDAEGGAEHREQQEPGLGCAASGGRRGRRRWGRWLRDRLLRPSRLHRRVLGQPGRSIASPRSVHGFDGGAWRAALQPLTRKPARQHRFSAPTLKSGRRGPQRRASVRAGQADIRAASVTRPGRTQLSSLLHGGFPGVPSAWVVHRRTPPRAEPRRSERGPTGPETVHSVVTVGMPRDGHQRSWSSVRSSHAKARYEATPRAARSLSPLPRA